MLAELEDGINRRPLVAADDNSLTPAHFLYGAPPPPLEMAHLGKATPPPQLDPKALTRMARHRNLLAAHLWRRWRNEYLVTLRNWRRPSVPQVNPLKVGDLVIMSPPDNLKLPRHLWPLAKVIRLFPGRDGEVRAAELKTKSAIIRRPINRLISLECAS